MFKVEIQLCEWISLCYWYAEVQSITLVNTSVATKRFSFKRENLWSINVAPVSCAFTYVSGFMYVFIRISATDLDQGYLINFSRMWGWSLSLCEFTHQFRCMCLIQDLQPAVTLMCFDTICIHRKYGLVWKDPRASGEWRWWLGRWRGCLPNSAVS